MENIQSSPEPQASLPLSLRYNLGITDTIPADKSIARFQAANASTFKPSGNNTCRVNVSSGAMLDLSGAYLEFEFTNLDANSVQFDGAADCVLHRVRVLDQSSSEIERIDNYNLLASVLDQYVNNDSGSKVSHALKGAVDNSINAVSLDDSAVSAATAGGADPTAAEVDTAIEAAIAQLAITGGAAGSKVYNQKTSMTMNQNVKRKFCVDLKLGWFNSKTRKLLPANTPFQLELSFAPSNQCLVAAAGTADYQVENVVLNVPQIEIKDPAFVARMNQKLASGMSWKSQSYGHYVGTTSGSSGKDVVQIACRHRALKGLMSIFRDQSRVSLLTKYKLSVRSIDVLSRYVYNFGAEQLPHHGVELSTGAARPTNGQLAHIDVATNAYNLSEAYGEVCRLFGNLYNPDASGLIGLENYGSSMESIGAGIIAINTSSFHDGSVNSGKNTLNGLPVSIEFTKNANVLAAQANNSATAQIQQIDTFSIAEIQFYRSPNGNIQSSM